MWTSACHRGAALNCPSLVLPQTCGSCWGLVGLLFLSHRGAQTLSVVSESNQKFSFSSHATVDQQSTVSQPVWLGPGWTRTDQQNDLETSGIQRSRSPKQTSTTTGELHLPLSSYRHFIDRWPGSKILYSKRARDPLIRNHRYSTTTLRGARGHNNYFDTY